MFVGERRLLSDPNLKASSHCARLRVVMIGGALKTEILREEALELTLEGFLPISQRGELPKEEKRSLFPRVGLPYVSDPAITKHLNAFLEGTGQIPDAILFNGGFFIPEVCRQRVADAVERWYGKRPEIFENRDLDLAVAAGAAYYSYVRSTGSGILVRGGLPRAYYIGIGDLDREKVQAVCLVPRGTEEGNTLELDRDDLQLVANRPVSFRLYSSLTRTEDKLGDRVEFTPGDENLHRPRSAERSDPGSARRPASGWSGEAGCPPHRSGHARDLVRIEGQRQSLATAIRAAQSCGRACATADPLR